MQSKSDSVEHVSGDRQDRSHAVVIGGSIAGLFAARILSEHFDRVTILENDKIPESPGCRKGQPHARHTHCLMAGGLAATVANTDWVISSAASCPRILDLARAYTRLEYECTKALHAPWSPDAAWPSSRVRSAGCCSTPERGTPAPEA